MYICNALRTLSLDPLPFSLSLSAWLYCRQCWYEDGGREAGGAVQTAGPHTEGEVSQCIHVPTVHHYVMHRDSTVIQGR